MNTVGDIEMYKFVLSGKRKTFPPHFWDRPSSFDSAAQITRFLLEDVLEWDRDKIKLNLRGQVFKDYALYGMLAMLFANSAFRALENAYPGSYKPWELKKCPVGFWNKETAKEAVIWLIEEKLHWNDEQVKDGFTSDLILQNGMRGMIEYFERSPFRILDNAYPGKFDPMELTHRPRGIWTKEVRETEITRLVVNILGINVDDTKTPTLITQKDFMDNGLYALLQRYHNSPIEAVKSVYPNNNWVDGSSSFAKCHKESTTMKEFSVSTYKHSQVLT